MNPYRVGNGVEVGIDLLTARQAFELLEDWVTVDGRRIRSQHEVYKAIRNGTIPVALEVPKLTGKSMSRYVTIDAVMAYARARGMQPPDDGLGDL